MEKKEKDTKSHQLLTGKDDSKTETPRQKDLPERDLKDQIALVGAIVSLGVVAYLLFFAPSLNWIRNGTKVGNIEVKGVARRRHSESLTWSDIKGNEQVYMKDVIYVPKDTTATLILDNKKKVIVPPDTMFQVDQSTMEDLEIILKEAPAAPIIPVFAKIKRASSYIEGVANFELRLSELKQRTLDRVFTPVDLEAARPTKAPEEFVASDFSDFSIRLVRPPLNKYNLAKNRWMLMTWTKLPFKDVSYVLQVSRDSEFKQVLHHSSKTNHLLIQFDEPRTYYWRVRGKKGNAEVVSDLGQFTMTEKGGLMTQDVPLRSTGQDRSLSSNNPVEIASDVKFAHIIKSLIMPEPKCPTTDLARGTYFCRVKSSTGSKVIKSYVFTVK